MDRRPYTVAMLSERWRCSEQFIRDEIKRGNLRAMRFGSKLIRIPADAVEDYEAQAVEAEAAAAAEKERLALETPEDRQVRYRAEHQLARQIRGRPTYRRND